MKELITALVTPFNEKGAIDLEILRFLIEAQVEAKVDGILLLGSTGESPTITVAERLSVIKTAVAAGKNRLKIWVGTGNYSTQETIERGKEATCEGADGLVVITPYYNKPTQEGLFQHFEAVLQAASLPVIIYNAPGRTSCNLSPSTVKRLASSSAFFGVKECAGVEQALELLQEEKPFVFAGDDHLAFSFLTAGAAGLISVTSNLLPEAMKHLVDLLGEGEIEAARAAHRELFPLFKALFIETNPMPIKAAMKLFGWPVGRCRSPLCEMQPSLHEQLSQLLNRYHSWKKSPLQSLEPLASLVSTT